MEIYLLEVIYNDVFGEGQFEQMALRITDTDYYIFDSSFKQNGKLLELDKITGNNPNEKLTRIGKL